MIIDVSIARKNWKMMRLNLIISSQSLEEEVQRSTIFGSLVLTVIEIKATITNLDLVAERAGRVVGHPRRAVR